MSLPAASVAFVGLAAVAAVGVVVLALRLALTRFAAPALPDPHPSPPRVVVLLPVRDEEENVLDCLAALRAQAGEIEIRVLDDGSTDRTAELARRVAATDPRLRVTTVPAPPAGANGKVHALATGSEGVAAEWILALDADARPAPDALARALGAAALHHLDAVSLAAAQRCETAGEALLTPLVFALLDGLLGDWDRAARGEGAPIANGQFLLVRRAALEAIGGYDALAEEPLDDVALARRLAGRGFRVGFFRARATLSVRMYRGFAATFGGWRRNLALIVGDRPRLALAAALVALLPALAAALSGATHGRLAWLAVVVAWAGGVAASALLRLDSGSDPRFGLLYPLDALAFSACLALAVRDRRSGALAPWRGRAVRAR
jgi:cellulose synthase/poly-beta-1,6-N-acetylglucosamine synthase-like glycosyltransferase